MHTSSSVSTVTPNMRQRRVLWHEFSYSFVDQLSRWKKVYSSVFVSSMIVMICMEAFIPSLWNPTVVPTIPTALRMVSRVYEVLAIGAIPILWWGFQKAMKAPSYLSNIPHEKVPFRILTAYKTFRVLLFYVFSPLICFSLSIGYGEFISGVLPHVASSQYILSNSQGGTVRHIFMACLTPLEELWRWAAILCILVLLKAISKQKWEHNTTYRRNAMVLAFIVSSLIFASGHLAEFPPQFKVFALLIFAGWGIIFGLATLLTRRLWVAMLAHGMYDGLGLVVPILIPLRFMATVSHVLLYVYGLAVCGVLFVLPTFWLLYRTIQKKVAS